MKRIFVTFSSPSFLPRANVCVSSVQKYYPNDTVVIIETENPSPKESYVAGLAKKRLRHARQLVDTYDEVIIIGADCVLYDKIDTFLEMPGTVLIPHVVTAPKDNASFYKTGHVNADLMLFRKCSIPLLDWLISQDMKEEPSNGSFYEQTLLSSAPFLFDKISICKDPGINYAYFNFHERPLWEKKGDYYIGDSDHLKMVQFSGYIPGNPKAISKYYSGTPNQTTLDLFQQYEDLIK